MSGRAGSAETRTRRRLRGRRLTKQKRPARSESGQAVQPFGSVVGTRWLKRLRRSVRHRRWDRHLASVGTILKIRTGIHTTPGTHTTFSSRAAATTRGVGTTATTATTAVGLAAFRLATAVAGAKQLIQQVKAVTLATQADAQQYRSQENIPPCHRRSPWIEREFAKPSLPINDPQPSGLGAGQIGRTRLPALSFGDIVQLRGKA